GEEGRQFKVPFIGQFSTPSWDLLTDKQRTAIAQYSEIRTLSQRALEGLRPNEKYQALLKGTMPEWDEPGMAAKLEQFQKFLQGSRDSAVNISQKTGRAVITPPGEPPAGRGPAAAPSAAPSAITPPPGVPKGSLRIVNPATGQKGWWPSTEDTVPSG